MSRAADRTAPATMGDMSQPAAADPEPHVSDKPDLHAMTATLRVTTEAFSHLGQAARKAAPSADRVTIADHPDLDDLNRELDNLYGGGFA